MAYSIKARRVKGLDCFYRESTSDLQVIAEVVERRCYRKPSFGFEVEGGENWLDLGANIGAFALYCRLRKACCECWEPNAECFEILQRNAYEFECFQSAVTASREPRTILYDTRSNSTTRFHCKARKSSLKLGSVANTWAGEFLNRCFDGVKMDIEGSEGPILDEWLLPRCEKLVLEYHTSADSDPHNLKIRLGRLKEKFRKVSYPPELDRICDCRTAKTYYDRMIFCLDPC